jgi:hypothetical protein
MGKFSRQTAQAARAASETGYTFEPRYPNGQGIGATITVRGPESQAVREVLRRQIAALQAREHAAKRSGREPEPQSIDEIEAQAIELAVAYTITWADFEDNGQPMAATEANFRAIYTDCPWIRRQVLDEAQDLGNFVRPASPSSSSTPAPSFGST